MINILEWLLSGAISLILLIVIARIVDGSLDETLDLLERLAL